MQPSKRVSSGTVLDHEAVLDYQIRFAMIRQLIRLDGCTADIVVNAVVRVKEYVADLVRAVPDF